MDTLTGHIRLDFRSQEPIYLQIVRQMEKLVNDGILKPGDQLPTVRQLAIDLRINFSTVARAYRILDEQRLISTQRGRGTYIWTEGGPDEPAQEQPAAAEGLPENQPPGIVEADRRQQARRLAQEFIADAARQGFTLDEIWLAVEQEIARSR